MCLDLKLQDSSSEVEVKRMLCRQRDHMERTVNELRAKLSKSAEDHEKVYVRIMKVKERGDLIFSFFLFGESGVIVPPTTARQENVSLITEINELRKELDAEKSLVKHYRSQVSVLKKTSKPLPELSSSNRDSRLDVIA